MNLFDRVKMLADERRMSISELERRIGASQNSLYKWKTQIPKIDKIEAIAEYFNVSTDYLLGLESYEQMKHDQANRDFVEEGASEYYYAIQRNAKKLNEEDQKKLFDIMQTVFDNIEELEDDDDGYL